MLFNHTGKVLISAILSPEHPQIVKISFSDLEPTSTQGVGMRYGLSDHRDLSQPAAKENLQPPGRYFFKGDVPVCIIMHSLFRPRDGNSSP